MRKGISLILLVITIIIIIILSGSIILTILPNNVISDSKATVQKGDFKTIADEFNLYKSNLYAKTDGKFDMTTINADSTNIGTICKTAEKYKDIFRIVNGFLEYTGNNSTEKALAKEYSMIYYGTEKTGTNISFNSTLETNIPSLTIYGKSNQSIPSGYTFYDYIVSSGTQYIDTGFIPNQNTTVEIDCEPNLNYKWLFGSRLTDTNSIDKFGIHINVTSMYPQYNGQYNSNVIMSNVFDRAIHKLSKNIYSINGITKHTFTVTTFSGTYSLYLLGMHQSSIDNRNFSGKIYSSKIWDNGSLVRNMIPAKRTSDNVIGFYDIVNNTFYTNSGTGVFTVGTAINLPTPYCTIDINSASNFNLSQTSKQNLIRYSEPTNSSEFASSGNISFRNATRNLTNYVSNEIYYNIIGTTAWSYFYSGGIKPGKDVYLQFYVEMDDESLPILGNTTTTGDFGVVINAALYPTMSNFTFTKINGTNVYIVTSKVKFNITSNTGIVKYSGQSNKKFRISRFKAVEDLNYDYIKTTGSVITEQRNTNIISTLRSIKVENNSSNYTYQDDSNNRYIADYIEMKNGKVNLVRNIGQYTFTGSEIWYQAENYQSITRFYSLTLDNKIGQSNTNTNLLSDKIACKSWNTKYIPLLNNIHTFYGDNRIGICIDNSLVGILSEDNNQTRTTKIKSWMANNNFLVQYALNTPVITDITNTEEGIALLNLKTQKGYTNIYDSSGLNLWKKIVIKEK